MLAVGQSADDVSRATTFAYAGLVYTLSFPARTIAMGAARGKNLAARHRLLRSSEDLLLEDCSVEAYQTNLVFQGAPEGVGRLKNVEIRRCVVVDAYSRGTENCAGLFAVSLLPFCTRMSGLVYLASALVLGAVFVAYAAALYRRYSDRRPNRLSAISRCFRLTRWTTTYE